MNNENNGDNRPRLLIVGLENCPSIIMIHSMMNSQFPWEGADNFHVR